MTNSKVVKLILFAVIAVTPVIATAACSSGSDAGPKTQADQPSNGIISPTWINAEKITDTVSISKNEMKTAGMAHFKLETNSSKYNFMAYSLNGQTYARANVCPPCRSIGFSLDGDELVCNSCRTRFDALTGNGISGACKDFPKSSVIYQDSNDRIMMVMDDLVTAYENTTKPGWP